MKPEELRIGNWVQYKDGRHFRIDTLSKGIPGVRHMTYCRPLDTIEFGLGVVEWKDITPIPLTPEWLERFGFRKFPKHNDWSKNGVIIHGRKRGWVLRKSVPDIKYVHQLQNLYYALTGEEL